MIVIGYQLLVIRFDISIIGAKASNE